MKNLGPSSTRPDSPSPYQRGAAQQFDRDGDLVNEQKEWLIDTGAEVSAISEDNADKFDLEPTGATAGGAEGGGGLVISQGPEGRPFTMHFQIVDKNGRPKNVSCDLPIAIIPEGEILGMDQLAQVHAQVDWCADTKTGRLYETPPPASFSTSGRSAD
jgi:hypothetical protein